MEKKTIAEELKTVQQEWMGNTHENENSREQEIVIRECSCLFD